MVLLSLEFCKLQLYIYIKLLLMQYIYNKWQQNSKFKFYFIFTIIYLLAHLIVRNILLEHLIVIVLLLAYTSYGY